MSDRININDLEPEAYTAMLGLQAYLNSTDLDAELVELIKIRASQINGCAYCIQMHTEEARKNGVSEYKLYALSAWKESPLFTEEECAVLAVTDEVTLVSESGLSNQSYETVLAILGAQKLAQLIMHIVTINTWNRIAVSTRLMHV